MKTLFISIGIAIILGLGAVYLYATPHPAPVASPGVPEPTATSAPTNTSTWSTYQNSDLGFAIDYPNDSTFTVGLDVNQGDLPHSTLTTVEPPAVIGSLVAICQSARLFTVNTIANRECFQIYVTPDPKILTSMPVGLEVSGTKTIDGRLFQILSIDPQVSVTNPFLHDYAYAIEHNGRYYIFQSSRGPADPIFEYMMASLKFQ